MNLSNLSFWERETFFKNIDYAIIGSGIVGLCAAIELKTRLPQKQVAIFERSFLPSGASTKNAGFACFGSLSEILKDLEQFTENEVYSLIESRWKGLQKLKNIVGEKNMDYEPVGGFEVFNDKLSFEKCADFLPEINKKCESIIGKNVYSDRTSNIDKFGFESVNHLIFNAYEGLVNTGKLMKSLISRAQILGISIFNGIEVQSIIDEYGNAKLVLANKFEITSNKILVTTNAFAKQLLPSLPLWPGRGQVIVTKPIANLRVKGAFHLDEGYFYFRNVGDRILLGGGRNLDFKAEETTEFGATPLVQNELKRLLEEVILPNSKLEIDYGWSGIMAFGSMQKPIIEAISSNVFCAVKCQGMGVALGATMADLAVELMLENE